jgi:predicted CoA-binding protein
MSANRSALDEATSRLRDPKSRIAVVGASNDPSKFGHIIVNYLVRLGYEVLPVNPNETSIAGLPAYRSLADVPKPVHIVNVVTPPDVTRQILKDAGTAELDLVWLQDGSFDDTVLADAARSAFETVHHACIMVVARQVAPARR